MKDVPRNEHSAPKRDVSNVCSLTIAIQGRLRVQGGDNLPFGTGFVRESGEKKLSAQIGILCKDQGTSPGLKEELFQSGVVGRVDVKRFLTGINCVGQGLVYFLGLD